MLKWLSAALGVAAIAAVWPGVPGSFIQTYARTIYPGVQAVLTPLSNRTPVPVFDVVWMGLVAGLIVATGIAIRRAARTRRAAPVARVLWAMAMLAAAGYLWFLTAWGWNYRRPGVEASLPVYEPARADPAAVRALAERAVRESNRLHAPAHAQGFPALDEIPAGLLASLHDFERELGRERPTLASRPKWPLTARYMRAVGVSGMLAPFFLETYLNPDLTGPERPYVLAHEWAHLSGFAPEEDASFVGVITSLRADVASRYSGWLFLLSESAMRLPPETRQPVLKNLSEGPRRDLAEIAARLQLRVAWLDRASWVAYDRAIKSQGARSGVAGYGRVIELLLGSGLLEEAGAW